MLALLNAGCLRPWLPMTITEREGSSLHSGPVPVYLVKYGTYLNAVYKYLLEVEYIYIYI